MNSLIVFKCLICFCVIVFLTGCHHRNPMQSIGHNDISFSMSPIDDYIVFNANGMGDRDLYLLTFDDKTIMSIIKVTQTVDRERSPAFSFYGDKIIYSSKAPGEIAHHIFIIDRDGRNRKQLTYTQYDDDAPMLSPDGERIVFIRSKSYSPGGLASPWGNSVVVVLNLTTHEETQITRDGLIVSRPRFSNDGMYIYYGSVDGIFKMSADGNGESRRVCINGTLSNDFSHIAFTTGEVANELELWVSDMDGFDETQILQRGMDPWRCRFDKEDKRVFFLRSEWPDGPAGVPKASLWVVNIDGSELSEIAQQSIFDFPCHQNENQID